jgi:hypothetical protein
VEGSSSDLDEFDSLIHVALGDLYCIVKKSDAPIVYIEDPAYKFSDNPEIIELVEKNKMYGNDEDYLGDHIMHVHNIANLYGNNNVLKQYYFVKLFPFSLGGDARNWYNALPPKSIISKDSCVQLFYGKYFPHSKVHAMKIDICKFAQRKVIRLKRIYNF